MGARSRSAAPRGARLRRAGGFTLLELMAVLALVALVSTVAIRVWFGRSEVTLQNATELLAAELRGYQTRAILDHAPIEIVFHEDGGGYHGHTLGTPDEARDARRYPSDAVFEDVRVGGVLLPRGERLVFDTLGRPNTDALITLVHRGVERHVRVDASAARIALEPE